MYVLDGVVEMRLIPTFEHDGNLVQITAKKLTKIIKINK